jgi:hypothetical protein
VARSLRTTAASLGLLVAGACTDDPISFDDGPGGPSEDVALEAGAQDLYEGQFQHGRGCTAADLDGDGDPDLVLSNPTDASRVLVNVSTPGHLKFVPGPVLHESSLVWGSAAADLDDDGDLDLFAATGGLEGREFDRLLLNEVEETGELSFADGTDAAGVLGPWTPDEPSFQVKEASLDAQFVDDDLDGDLDIWVDNTQFPTYWLPPPPGPGVGSNTLWRNNGDGTFTDVAHEVGLGARGSHRFSSWLDLENDGDLDVYVNVNGGPSAFFRNDGGVFTDVSAEVSLDGGDLTAPPKTFATAPTDVNNDGYEDLILFARGWPVSGPYLLGHTLLLNVQGKGFVDVSAEANLNDPFEPGLRDHESNGVMGATIRDISGDGIPDVFLGNGGPSRGTVNNLYLSVGLREVDLGGTAGVQLVPLYENRTDLVDIAAKRNPDLVDPWPVYPYRTHAACVADYDGDGLVELYVMNGGMSLVGGTTAREPNQLFRFTFEPRPHWLKVAVHGDGVHVPTTPFGTRITVTAGQGEDSWDVRDRLRSVEGFAAQHDPVRWFGLGAADRVERVTVEWTDGTTSTVDDPALDTTVTFDR